VSSLSITRARASRIEFPSGNGWGLAHGIS
jgi:hypothetical protein